MAWREGLVIAIGLGCVLDAVPAAGALQSHRAFYRLSLADASGLEPLSGVQGGLVIEWRRACEGWLSRQRLGFVAASEEGLELNRDVRFSSWEAADGSSLRYSVRSFDGDELREEFRGEARLDGRSGGVARFTEPEERDVPLPAGTVFPTGHLERLLSGAEEGQRVLTHEVFDGWGFDSLTQITAVIGEPRPLEPAAGGSSGERSRAWPVSMAYYNIEARSDVPEFEAQFLLGENGVLRDLALDYGDFAFAATLEQLELLEAPDC